MATSTKFCYIPQSASDAGVVRDPFLDFITSVEWPHYSPDLSIWQILHDKACAKPHKNLETLKQSLQRGVGVWDRLSAEELQCIDAEGGQSEAN